VLLAAWCSGAATGGSLFGSHLAPQPGNSLFGSTAAPAFGAPAAGQPSDDANGDDGGAADGDGENDAVFGGDDVPPVVQLSEVPKQTGEEEEGTVYAGESQRCNHVACGSRLMSRDGVQCTTGHCQHPLTVVRSSSQQAATPSTPQVAFDCAPCCPVACC